MDTLVNECRPLSPVTGKDRQRARLCLGLAASGEVQWPVISNCSPLECHGAGNPCKERASIADKRGENRHVFILKHLFILDFHGNLHGKPWEKERA